MSKIQKKIYLQLKEIDGWPNGICEDCKSKLTITTNFFNICKNTQNILLEQLGEKKTPLLENSFDDSEDNSQLTQSSSGIFNNKIVTAFSNHN